MLKHKRLQNPNLWEYVRTESGVIPYASDGCYQPTVHRAEEGLVQITVTHCGKPPEARTTLRMEWTKPPRILYPSEPFDFQLKTTLIGNLNPNWVLNGQIYMRPEVVSDRPPFGGGVMAEIHKGTPSVVVWDNLRMPAERQEKAPPGWWAIRLNPLMRLSFVSVFSNEHWWAYVYRYVDPTQRDRGNAKTGYQLYFDGKLVSGSDAATYTREQAEQNCRWNMQNNSNFAIRCAYNGIIFAEQNRNSGVSISPSSTQNPSSKAPTGNVALRKPSFATSTYAPYGSGNANDGDATSIWNGGRHEACWSVDLQSVYAIQTIEVSSNQFGSGGLKTVFQVSSSLNNTEWSAIATPITAIGDQTFTISAGGAQMRYIRYCTLAGSTNWATLGELKAYGISGQRQ